ncbi:MAG: hypothetical protein FWD68_16150 [Alphaproteobacteria bacterium]|nr:hypothetical protein [Alphaproteobacteria bacterium]
MKIAGADVEEVRLASKRKLDSDDPTESEIGYLKGLLHGFADLLCFFRWPTGQKGFNIPNKPHGIADPYARQYTSPPVYSAGFKLNSTRGTATLFYAHPSG